MQLREIEGVIRTATLAVQSDQAENCGSGVLIKGALELRSHPLNYACCSFHPFEEQVNGSVSHDSGLSGTSGIAVCSAQSASLLVQRTFPLLLGSSALPWAPAHQEASCQSHDLNIVQVQGGVSYNFSSLIRSRKKKISTFSQKYRYMK